MRGHDPNVLALRHQAPNRRRADEAAAAGDKDHADTVASGTRLSDEAAGEPHPVERLKVGEPFSRAHQLHRHL